MANEKVAIDTWLMGLLSTDATILALVPGGVWQGQAPPPLELRNQHAGGVDYPVIVFDMNHEVDITTLNASRVMVDCVYLVKAIASDANQLALRPIADRLDVLLHRITAVTSDIRILNCWRESIVGYPELDSGTYFRHLGGLYHLQAQ